MSNPTAAEKLESEERRKEALLEDALRTLAAVDVPSDLTAHILGRTSEAPSLAGGFLGFRRRQWAIAGASFGVWALAMQGVFSWMLGGVSAL